MGVREWLDRYGVPLAIASALGVGTYLIMPTLAERRRINRLEPGTRAAYRQFLKLMSNRGIRIHTGQTVRDTAQQAALVESGASGTNRSWHLLGRAIDAYPYDPDTGKPDMQGRRLDLFRIMHETAAVLGFHGLAFRPYPDGPKRYITTSKGSVWDGGHLEYHGPYNTWAEAADAMRSRKAIA